MLISVCGCPPASRVGGRLGCQLGCQERTAARSRSSYRGYQCRPSGVATTRYAASVRGERIIAAVAALGLAVFSGFVFSGMSEVGDPNVVLAAVMIGVSLLAAAVSAIGPAKWAAGVAIALGMLSGLALVGTLAAVGLENALDLIWLGITTVVLIGAGLRLLRQPGQP